MPNTEETQFTDSAVSVLSSSAGSLKMQYSLSNLQHSQENINGVQFDRYEIKGESNTGLTGYPSLPTVTRLVLIPPQTGVEVIISNVSFSTQSGVKPFPVEALSSINATFGDESSPHGQASDRTLSYVKEFEEQQSLWPPELATTGEPAIMRGYRLVPLIINPVRWNPATRELEVVESMDIEFNFNTDVNRVNIVTDPERPRPSKYIDRLIRNTVVNPPPERDHEDVGGSIAYVMGSGGIWNNVVRELEPLVEWRRRMGWTVGIIEVEDNENRFAVKAAIQEAYDGWDNPPEFIVLVADAPGLEGNDYTIAYWNEQHGARTAYETDHHYCELEGDDLLPEAAIGRLVFNTIPLLRGQVNKIIQYESDPYIGNDPQRGWQLRGIVAATDARSGNSSIDMCEWTQSLMLRKGFTDVDEFYWTEQDHNRNPTDFLTTNINAGVSFVVYRGWSEMNGYDTEEVNRLHNERMLPFVMLATCNTGDYGQNIRDPNWSYIERFAWHAGGGAIGAVGAAGATHTAYNNILATTTIHSIFVNEIHSQGWALMAGKMALFNHYAGRNDIDHPENPGLQAWEAEFYIYNLMGDPAVSLFTDMPKRLIVNHPDEIRYGESRVDVVIDWEDAEDGAEGVQVCMYKPGEFQLVEWTDAEGRASFNLNPDQTQEGMIQLTASGPNIRTYLADLEVERGETFIGATEFVVDDDDGGDSNGDGDGTANPTERIELRVDLTNFGAQRPEGGLTVDLRPLSPHLDVVEDQVEFNSPPRQNEHVTAEFLVEIGGGFPHGEDAVFEVYAHTDDLHWTSSILVPVEGPQVEFDWLEWDEDPIAPGDTADFYISLSNVGSKPTGDLSASLISLSSTISVIWAETQFNSFNPDQIRESENPLRIYAHSLHIKGTNADFALVVTGVNGFQDTAFFSQRISRIEDGEPFGPDRYGYICLDNTDTDWASHPRFDWIEIDPEYNGPGRNTGLSDLREEEDASTMVNLPFDFIYYGESFDRITICTNGWAAFGDHRAMISARNRRIPGGEISPAMLCPFWDDLVTPNGSGIYYWHDADQHKFVIEWSRLQKLGPLNRNEAEETFEIILYDPEYHATQTGDGNIEFLYLEVTDSPSAFEGWDTPFATIGIGSPDQSDGIEYTYYGQRHEGAAEIEPELAIKFTTTIQFNTTNVSGTVTDAATGAPLSDVEVRNSYGTWAMTDENGHYVIEETIIANNYQFHASKEFYCDSTLTGIDIVPEEENIVDFALLHPEFSINPGSLEMDAFYIDSLEERISISNDGNGLLEYLGRLVSIPEDQPGQDNPDEVWDMLFEWSIEDTTDDNRIQGIVYCDDHWIVSGGARGREENWFYRFSDDGRYLGSLPQPVETRYGVRDMDYFEGAIYTVFSTTELLKINPATGEILRSWDLPDQLTSPRAIALDPDNRRVFISGTMFGIYEFEWDADSSLVWNARHDVVDPRGDQLAIHPYGMGWYRDDPDGYQLYLYTKDEPVRNNSEPDISIYKLDPKHSSIEFVTDLPFIDASKSGRAGMSITANWSSRTWVMAAVLDNANPEDGDRIGIFDLGSNFSWVDFEPRTGEVNPGDSQDINMLIHTGDLLSGDYAFAMEFEHNASPGTSYLPVNISVLVDVPTEAAEQPKQFELSQNYPNPFNPSTIIAYRIPGQMNVKVSIVNVQGREVATLLDQEQTEGRHQLQFDASDLAAGIYFYRIRAGEFSDVKKMVLIQ